jgi:hypothetical protein
MLQSISKLGTVLGKKEQSTIKGGAWPRTEQECLHCGGEWYAPLCALPHDSPCA